MRPGRLHTTLYYSLRVLQIILVIAMGGFLFLALNFIPIPAQLKTLVDTQGKSINAGLAACLGLTVWMLKLIGAPWLWKCIKGILGSFQRDIFRDAEDGSLSNHQRVTLYRYQTVCLWPKERGRFFWPWGKGCWPWSGWLVPVVRAGPEREGNTVFLCGELFEGVCGAAYSQQSGVLEISAASLPDITSLSIESDISTYARGTFVTEEMIHNRISAGRPCARYFLAHRVEVQSVKWGVLMIDCRVESPDQPKVAAHRFAQIRDVLDHLLRRA